MVVCCAFLYWQCSGCGAPASPHACESCFVLWRDDGSEILSWIRTFQLHCNLTGSLSRAWPVVGHVRCVVHDCVGKCLFSQGAWKGTTWSPQYRVLSTDKARTWPRPWWPARQRTLRHLGVGWEVLRWSEKKCWDQRANTQYHKANWGPLIRLAAPGLDQYPLWVVYHSTTTTAILYSAPSPRSMAYLLKTSATQGCGLTGLVCLGWVWLQVLGGCMSICILCGSGMLGGSKLKTLDMGHNIISQITWIYSL